MTPLKIILEIKDLTVAYKNNGAGIEALRDFSIQIEEEYEITLPGFF